MLRLALIGGIAALAVTAGAQSLLPSPSSKPKSAEAAPDATPSPTPPAPIPLPALVAEAEDAERFARGVAELTAPRSELARIEESLAKLHPEIEQRSERLPELTGATAPIAAVEAELRGWELSSERLERWQRAPTRQLEKLDDTLAEISERLAIWDRTREAAREAQAPPEALARIASVRRALERARREAIAAQRGLVDLQARIAHDAATAREAMEALTAARLRVRSALLTRDSPPLWSAFSAHVGPRAREQFATDARIARDYAEGAWPRLLAQLALFAVAAGLALRLRSRAGHLHEDPRLAASTIIFDRPFSSAALLVIALNSAFHPNAPALALVLAFLIAIVAVLRILPALVDAALKPAIWVVAVLAAIDALGSGIAGVTPIERVLVSLKLAIASAALFWMMRPARLARVADPSAVPRWIQPLLHLARAAFVVAFAASVLGWTNLAHLIGDGTLRSAYAALLIYSAARVLRAGLRAVVRSEAFARLPLFRDHAESVITTGVRVVNLAGLALWALRTLDGFALAQPILAIGLAIWRLDIGFGALSLALGDVLTFGITIWAAFTLARFVRFVIEGGVAPRFDAKRGVAHAVGATAQYALLLLGFFAAAAASGIDMSRFSLLAGAFGVGVGFGLQNVINNFVSGLILLYERPIQVGDAVDVGGGVTGEVKEIGVRSSTVRTYEGAHVIVPNATLISERVTNWTFADRRRRVDLKVGVAYGSDPRRVIELLLESARGTAVALAEPPPVAVFASFGDSSLNFDLRFWTYFEDVLVARSEVGLAVHDALKAAGIEVPFPQIDVHLTRSLPAS
jgi:small-conductance mechanosensitive channel